MKKLLAVVGVVLALAVTGCATSSGVEVKTADTTFVKKGRTTKAQLIEKLGPPTSDTIDSNGKQTLVWSYSKSTVNGASYIPIYGMFAGGGTSETKAFSVTLDRKGVVQDYEHLGAKSEGRLGY